MEESIYDDLLGMIEEVKMNSENAISVIKNIYSKSDHRLEDDVINYVVEIIYSVEDIKDIIGYNE